MLTKKEFTDAMTAIEYRAGSITQHGKPIKLKTIADLYALLKKEYKNKKRNAIRRLNEKE